MAKQKTTRRVRTPEKLEKLLARIEGGEMPRPEWIELRGSCSPDTLDAADLTQLVRRLHGAVLRGFRAPDVDLEEGEERLAFWRAVAAGGFHDFSELGFTKCWASPWQEDYDYVRGYLERGIEGLDAFQVYSAVLGTHDYGVEDFVTTKLCDDVQTIIEPMAGSAEFAYAGHFRYPDLRYVMFDLDPAAREHVLARRWLPRTDVHYLLGNVLDEGMWKQIGSLGRGRSLSYIGKQSHHFLDARELLHLLELGTRYVDWFMLEVPEPSLVGDLDPEEDLTRPEMEDAGFQAGLVDDPGVEPNPLTNHMSFSLQVWDERQRRTLFRYTDWTSWQAPTLVALAGLVGARGYFYHADEQEFWPVEEADKARETAENVNFLVFSRHGEAPR